SAVDAQGLVLKEAASGFYFDYIAYFDHVVVYVKDNEDMNTHGGAGVLPALATRHCGPSGCRIGDEALQRSHDSHRIRVLVELEVRYIIWEMVNEKYVKGPE
ncbi:hypothetical protein ACLOJK_014570, partial [Asimina triloba]